MKREVLVIFGLILIFSFGCPAEEDMLPEPEINETVEEPEAPPEEEPEEGELEEPITYTCPDGTIVEDLEECPEFWECPNGTLVYSEEEFLACSEEPEEEGVCSPVAVSGNITFGVYEEDVVYFERVKAIAYVEEMEIGQKIGLRDGAEILLEEIVVNGTCEECEEKPSWTYSQKARLRITPEEGQEVIVTAGRDEHGFFYSSYKCKTIGFENGCIEYIPDTERQYYIWKVNAEKVCQ